MAPLRASADPVTAPAARRLLYIAGYGRSGSTLLDIVLSAHSRIEGFGELADLFTSPVIDQPDGFWAQLDPLSMLADADLTKDGDGDSDGAERAHRHLVGAERLVPTRAPARGVARRAHLGLHRPLFERLFEATGAEVVVDSSKTSWLRAWRLPLLARAVGPDTEVCCLILVRPLPQVVASVRGGHGETLEPHRLPTVRAVVGWSLANLLALWSGLTTCGRAGTRRLRYADLTADPSAALDGVGSWLGLGPDQGWTNGIEHGFQPGHQVAGNRVRSQARIRIEPRPPLGSADGVDRGSAGGIVAPALRLVSALVEGALGFLVADVTADRRPQDRQPTTG